MKLFSALTVTFVLALVAVACSPAQPEATAPPATAPPTTTAPPTPKPKPTQAKATATPTLPATLTPAPTFTSPANPTRLKIFLVALGDKGQSGKLIGCD